MWPFGRATKERLQEHKTVWIDGLRFTIRKVNPLLDFTSDKMPQIFTDVYSKRGTTRDHPATVPEFKKLQADMMNVVQAGLIAPKLGKDLSVEDIFSNPDLGAQLFQEIIIHSLNRFRGIKGVFFSIKIRRSILALSRQSMGFDPSTSSSPTETTP